MSTVMPIYSYDTAANHSHALIYSPASFTSLRLSYRVVGHTVRMKEPPKLVRVKRRGVTMKVQSFRRVCSLSILGKPETNEIG